MTPESINQNPEDPESYNQRIIHRFDWQYRLEKARERGMEIIGACMEDDDIEMINARRFIALHLDCPLSVNQVRIPSPVSGDAEITNYLVTVTCEKHQVSETGIRVFMSMYQ